LSYTVFMNFKILLAVLFSILSFSYVSATTVVYKPSNGFTFQDCTTGGYNPTRLNINSSYFSTSTDSSGQIYQTFPCTTTHQTQGANANFLWATGTTIHMDDQGFDYLWYIGEGRADSGTGYFDARYQNTGIDYSSASNVYYFDVDGYNIEAIRIAIPSGCISSTCPLFSSPFSMSPYPNRSYDLNDRYRFYGVILTTDSSLLINSASSMYEALGADTGGGGGGATSTNIYSEIVTSASLYSGQLITSPTSSSTYTFTSSIASSTLKQSAVIFLTHTATSTPAITLGGSSMTLLDATESISGYVTSLFVLRHPLSGTSTVITGISNGAIKYISQTVWSNADIFPVFDKYEVITSSNKASISLPTTDTPSTLVASLYSVSGLSDFDLLSGSTLKQSATSTTGDFGVTSALCNSPLDDCGVGYVKPFRLFDTRNGVIIGLAMYSTSSISLSTTPSLGAIAGGLGTDQGFASCLDEGFTGGIICGLKNLVFWVLNLFVPSTSDMLRFQTVFYNQVTASSSLVSSVFLIPVQFSTWMSTTSIPTYTKLEIYVPSFIDDTWVLDPSPATTVDQNVHDMLLWMLGTAMVLFIGYRFWKIV